MTKHEFLNKLQNADWYYEYSDDMRCFRAGRQEQLELSEIAKKFGFEDLLKKYRHYVLVLNKIPTEQELEEINT